MHPCPGNWVAIGHAVVFFPRAAHALSAGIKCRHCMSSPGCLNTFKIILKCDNFILENIQTKWSTMLNEEVISFKAERAFGSLRKIPANPYTKYILFRLLHSRIFTNNKLAEMNFYWKILIVHIVTHLQKQCCTHL